MPKDPPNKKHCLNLTGAADFLNATHPELTQRKLCTLKKHVLTAAGWKVGKRKTQGYNFSCLGLGSLCGVEVGNGFCLVLGPTLECTDCPDLVKATF